MNRSSSPRAELTPIIAGFICLHSAMAGTRLAAPLLALKLGYDNTHVGILIALFAVPQALFALPAGRWADRRGLKVPVRWSVLVAMLAGALAATSLTYAAMCVTAVGVGAAIATAAIALQRHVGRAARTPAQLAHAFSWLSLAPALSNLMGPLMAGVVIDHVGYRVAFIVLASMPLIGWCLIRTARELPNEARHAADSEPAWNLLRDATFRRLLLINWFSAASFDVHGFVVPVLGHQRGLSASAVGVILGAFAGAAAAIRVFLPLLVARVREWKVISGAMAIATVILMLYPFAYSAIAMAVCSALIGMSVGTVQPMVMSLLHQVTPPHRHGEAVAMRLLMVNVSSVAMPLLFGAAGALVGVSSVFWFMGALTALGTRLGLGVRVIAESARHANSPTLRASPSADD